MKKLFAATMSAVMTLSLTACSSSNSPSTAASDDASKAADTSETTAEGNKTVVTLAKENDVVSMDTSYATDGMSFEIIAATVQGLETVAEDGAIIPGIAESYETSNDDTTYTFKLRDANWDNGEPVTAEDFVFAWDTTVKNPEAEYAYLFGSDGACIKGADEILGGDKEATLDVKAIDDKTLEVNLTQKVPYFLFLTTFPVFYPINEAFFKEQGDNYGLTPENLLANGPYKLTEWTSGTNLKLAKNEAYWDANAIEVDEINVNIVPEASTSALDFEAGNTDFTKLNSTLVDKYKDNEAYDTFLEGYLWYLQYNMDNEILKNANIRKGLSTVVDRVDLTENVLKDGSVALGGFVPMQFALGPDGKDYVETGTEYFTETGDEALTKAKEYWEAGLKELGKDSVTLRLLYEPADPSKPAAEFIQSQLQQLPGLTIEMVSQEKKNRIELQKQGDFDIVLTRWGPDYADPTTYLNLMITGNSYNYGNYSNKEYDKLMKEAAATSDQEKRWEMLHEAEAILMEDLPVVGIFQVGGASLVNPKVTGIEDHSAGVPYLYYNLKKAE
ncbi:peptide ABC transporter substrate-binding protein [Ileibacterium valens]|uniref:peptide ABC transporter substrate-binding protein n=1 Tax=Ileibacterium valens TaxID=1862668 RepID=UPI0023577F6C|nr:peptide ABC transporter substrate-binding protein [Ileibacterium valens]